MTRFGENLRLLREEHGLSQSALAEAIGMSRRSKGYISELEHGRKTPTTETLLALSRLFNISIDELLVGSTRKESADDAGDTI